MKTVNTASARFRLILALALFAIGCLLSIGPVIDKATAHAASLPVKSSLNYYQLPLAFEVNRGQSKRDVEFVARGRDYAVLVTGPEAHIRRSDPASTNANLGLSLVGSNKSARAAGLNELPGRSNYFLGNDPKSWITDVTTYARVKVQDVYPGIDLVYYGNPHNLEYDIIIAPGRDLRRVVLEFKGAESVSIDECGDLRIRTELGEFRQAAPDAYQQIGGKRVRVASSYKKVSSNRVRVETANYDKRRELVIDPILVYSTPLGGTLFDAATGIAVDSQGNSYITGSTASTDFPQANPLPSPRGTFTDAFLVKVNASGNGIVYSVYIGGNDSDGATAVAIDASGNAYLSGRTFSSNFPLAGGPLLSELTSRYSGFVAKIGASGSSLQYSTYLGGDGVTSAQSVGVDGNGRVFAAGFTQAESLPFAGLSNIRGGLPLFRSTNQGSNFDSISHGLTGGAVAAVGVATGEPLTIYAGTETGLFRTLDGGVSWQRAGANNDDTRLGPISAIAVDPVDPAVVYVASAFAVLKSTDRGANFTRMSDGLSFSGVLSLAISRSDRLTLYVATNQGVYKTINGGVNWGLAGGSQGSQFIIAKVLAVDPTNSSVAYAVVNSSFAVYKTVNGGVNWNPTGGGLPPTVKALTIDPNAPSTIYTATSSYTEGQPITIFKSLNGGQTWFPSGDGFQQTSGGQIYPLVASVLVNDEASPGVLYAAAQGSGIYRTANFGQTWTRVGGEGLSSKKFQTLAFGGNPRALLAGTDPGMDAWIARISNITSNSSTLDFCKMFSGNESDQFLDVAVDGVGNAYVAGVTDSTNIQVTNALQPEKRALTDGYIAKIGLDGNVVYSTFLGGNSLDQINSLAVDSNGNVYVTGDTFSSDFPQEKPLSPASSFYLKAFVAKLAADGSRLLYSTYLGGSQGDSGRAIAVDRSGNAFVTGVTASPDFKTVSAIQQTLLGSTDAFVVRISAVGSSLLYSTFLGGGASDSGSDIAVDSSGNAYVVGSTSSFDFPAVNPLQPARGSDAFVAKLGLQADVSVTQTDEIDPVMVGNDLRYTLTVKNAGTDVAETVVVTDEVPAGTSILSVIASKGSCNVAGPVTCNIGELAVNETATVTATLKPNTAGVTLTNRASVASMLTDPNPGNNSSTEETRISASPSIAGRVSFSNGAPAPGVKVVLSGSKAAEATTSADGKYQFSDLQVGGGYKVRPMSPGLVFRPSEQDVSNIAGDRKADFASVRCLLELTPKNQSFPAGGGEGSFSVSAPDAQCSWSVRSNANWITVTSAPESSGSNQVRFTVSAANTGRSGTISVGNEKFTVWQEAGSCGVPDFKLPKSFYGGGEKGPITTADFNNDGRPDVAMANGRSTVSVLLNNGSGGFAAALPFPVTNLDTPRVLIGGDFNKDGNIDLAIEFFGFVNNFAILLGDGKGGFAQPRFFQVSGQGSDAVVGDFNSDGNPDIAMIIQNPNAIRFLAGLGNGSFAAPVNYPVSSFFSGLESLTAADMNGDGKMDLVTESVDGALILTGNGMGQFTESRVSIPGLFGVRAVEAADFNGDAKPDLLILSLRSDTGFISSMQLTTLPNKGSGMFEEPKSVQIGTTNQSEDFTMVASDLNSDGKTDVVILGASSGVLSLKGNGLGQFDVAGSYFPGYSAMTPVLADFTGDGKRDLVVSSLTSFIDSFSGRVNLLPGDGLGGFDAPRNTRIQYSAGAGIPHILLLDLSGDGKPDLATISENSVVLRQGDGAGNFGPNVTITIGSNPFALASGDLNSDGRPDLLVSNEGSNSLSLILGGASGLPTTSTSIPLHESPHAIALADFNGDQKTDVVVAFRTHIAVFPGQGNGTVGSPILTIVTGFFATLLDRDLNGDGLPDLIGAVSSASFGDDAGLSVLINDGNGSFRLIQKVGFQQQAALSPSTADINGDGYLDVVFAQESGGFVLSALGMGNGMFGPVSSNPLPAGQGFYARQNIVTDINNDGKPDAIVISSSGEMFVLLGDGTGRFTPPTRFSIPQAFDTLVSDFDGDGRSDLGFANANLTVVLSRCLGSRLATVVSAASYQGNVIARGSLAVAFGTALANSTETASSPLPKTLGGTKAIFTDTKGIEYEVELLYASPGQLNFLVPSSMQTGPAVMTITNAIGGISKAPIIIENTVPSLFSAQSDGGGLAAAQVLRIKANGSQSYEPVAIYDETQKRFVAVPIDLGPVTDQVYLVLYGTGIRFHEQFSFLDLRLSGNYVQVTYADAQGFFAGLDQINALLNRNLAGKGEVDVVLTLSGFESNVVKVTIK